MGTVVFVLLKFKSNSNLMKARAAATTTTNVKAFKFSQSDHSSSENGKLFAIQKWCFANHIALNLLQPIYFSLFTKVIFPLHACANAIVLIYVI